MSLTLNLGVADIPYENDPAGKSTGDVAGYLENRYHVMEVFFRENDEAVAGWLSDSLAATLESVLMGAPTDGADPFAEACSRIENAFREFLALDTMARLGYPGVPTKAALEGVNLRLKLKHGEPRPSFISSGQYQAAMRSWVSDA